jgi:membrane peptidoglycan carboxypeptidase
MSQGRLGRSTRRYPGTQRRASHFANSRFGHRGRGLPPHLMPGVTRNNKKKETVFSRRNFIIGTFLVGLIVVFTFLVVSITSGIAAAFGVVRQYREVNKGLPNAANIAVNTFQTTRIYDRKGSLLQEVDHPDYGWRTFIGMDQMTDDFINATVAAEDATFWTNQGIEPVAFLRAGLIMFSGSGSSGASTITQQLVRAVYPDVISAQDVSIDRKFREALAAVAMAQEYSKEDIFTMYVNQIYYGARSYGVEAAANTFFNKHASELTLAESALLAGLPQAPSYYDPSTPEGFEQAKIRQRYVLEQMRKYRYITTEQMETAWAEPLQIVEGQRTSVLRAAPHFTQYIQQYLREEYGQEAIYAGLEVYTSIDLDLQAEAEQIVANGVANMRQYGRNNGALVVMTPWNGEVLCMVGSADFNDASIGGQFNYATGLIQPGSSMKPLAYASAFERGWNPATVIMDVPTRWEVPGQDAYEPNNYTKLFYGAIPVREALAQSLNIPAVKATEYAGVAGVMDTAARMGLVTSLGNDPGFYGVSLGLGSGEVKLLEHTNAFATLANNGRFVKANPIQRILDSQGNTLMEVNKAYVDERAKEGINPGIAYQITSILTDNEARAPIFGTNNLFGNTQDALGRPAAAKSGTTENWRDLWAMGYTTAVACGAWVGRTGDAGTAQLPEIDGTDAAGPIWQDMMLLIHNDSRFAGLIAGPDGNALPESFPVPDEVREMDLCATTGHLPGNGPRVREWVVRGQEPTLSCNEVNDYEAEELEKALAEVRRGGNWAGGAVGSINDYARMVGGTPVPVDDEEDEDGGDNQIDGPDVSDGQDPDEQPPIEPLN